MCTALQESGEKHTTLEVMTGIRPKRAMLQVLTVEFLPSATLTLKRATKEWVALTVLLQRRLHEMNKEVECRVDKRPKAQIAAHNKEKNIITS